MAARDALAPGMDALEIERAALEAFLGFAAENKGLYRIIDEAEFVDPESYRAHYERIGRRIEERLLAGGEAGTLRTGLGSTEAWMPSGRVRAIPVLPTLQRQPTGCSRRVLQSLPWTDRVHLP